LLASISHDGALRLQTVPSDRSPRDVFRREERAFALALSPDGRLLASASSDVRRDVTAAAEPRMLRGKNRVVLDLTFSPGSDLLAAGAGNGAVVVWRVANSTEPSVKHGHDGPVLAVAFSPDGNLLASA